MDDRHEQYCPNCSGVSPTGGYCAACLAMLIAAERGDNSSWLQEDSFTAFGRNDDDGNEAFGDDAFIRDGDDENTSPSRLSLSGERVTRDLMPGATARPDAGVPGRPAPDPPPILPLSTPTVLADPVLRELLPSDPDTATRLLSDLTLIGDCLDAAAALHATGNVAQTQAAEQAAREVYDFWSAFYRNQERLALIAERLHELTVASIEAAEAARVAGQADAQALDNDAALRKSWNRANTDPVFQPAHPGADLASFGIARDPSTMTPQEQADYMLRQYATSYQQPLAETPQLRQLWEEAATGNRSYDAARDRFWEQVNHGNDANAQYTRAMLEAANFQIRTGSQPPLLNLPTGSHNPNLDYLVRPGESGGRYVCELLVSLPVCSA